MDYTHSLKDGRCEVCMQGTFTFFDNKNFNAIQALLHNPAVTSMVFNFKDVEFIDSAALGMLLMAKEEADKRHIKLVLVNAARQVEKAFNVSGFGAIFAMKE